MLRARQRSQSVVEFGIIAILFTLLLFAIADFGLLLNDWLSVSSGARQLGRDAAVGMFSCPQGQCPGGVTPDLWNEAKSLNIPGVGADAYFTGGYCCTAGTPGSALQVTVTYYDQCTPGVGGCAPLSDLSKLDSRFSSNGSPGTCNLWQTPGQACSHPAPPATANVCGKPNCPGDTVIVTLKAAGAQVITPLIRPFFGCPSNSPKCYVPLSSSATLRVEGDTL
ncbi:MAG TPA: TadE family protein [Chloroflexota bacterium]|jgi:hypothetical protein